MIILYYEEVAADVEVDDAPETLFYYGFYWLFIVIIYIIIIIIYVIIYIIIDISDYFEILNALVIQ